MQSFPKLLKFVLRFYTIQFRQSRKPICRVHAVLFDKVRTRITSQVSKYMPFLNVRNIDFITSEQDDSLNPNTLYVKIRYTIPALNANDEIQLTVNNYEF